MQQQIDKLKTLIAASSRIVAFTGAGISTECGIPDFRSPGGIWSKYKPIDFKTFMSSEAARREGLTRYLKIVEAVGEVKPGRGHAAIACLHERGKLLSVITQNIDGLHLASGVPASQIIELHGNGTYAKCLGCKTRHELDWVARELDRISGAPVCVACGGIVKTATISFGQSMPEVEMERAEAASLDCDLFIVLGSSLVVYPAAGFPLLARRAGARLVIVNAEATDHDGVADLVIHADIGDVLEQTVLEGDSTRETSNQN